MPRSARTLLLLALFASPALAETPVRYGVAPDAKAYPQATAKEALSSVVAAVKSRRIDYIVAHLADPTFIDERVKTVHGGQFTGQVSDTTTRLEEPAAQLLARFHKEGKWTIDRDRATVELEDVPDRVVRLLQVGGAWYLVNRYDPEPR